MDGFTASLSSPYRAARSSLETIRLNSIHFILGMKKPARAGFFNSAI